MPSDIAMTRDATSIPPVVALTPVSGLDLGTGFQIGPLVAFLDLLGLALVYVLVRRHCLPGDDQSV
jgi:hypothetical protein